MKTIIGITRDLDLQKTVEVNNRVVREFQLRWGFDRVLVSKIAGKVFIKWSAEGFYGYPQTN